MNTVNIDASRWTSAGDFYEALLPALGAPAGHGHSIDALIDSIIGGGMNAVEPPYAIVISGTAFLDRAILDHLKMAKNLLAEARMEARAEWGQDVDATIEFVS